MFIHRSGQSLLCKQRTFFKSSTDTNAHNHWRTGIRSCISDCCQNCIFHTFDTICRFQHKNTAHIFTAKSFWCNGDFHFITRNNFCMQNCRCIIFCIFTDQRIFYHGFSQISIHITTTHTFIDRFLKITTHKMYILSDFHKNNCHSRILTDWNHLFVRNFQIFLKLIQNFFAKL